MNFLINITKNKNGGIMNNPFINGALAKLYLTYNPKELERASKRYTAEAWELIITAMHEMKSEVNQ